MPKNLTSRILKLLMDGLIDGRIDMELHSERFLVKPNLTWEGTTLPTILLNYQLQDNYNANTFA